MVQEMHHFAGWLLDVQQASTILFTSPMRASTSFLGFGPVWGLGLTPPSRGRSRPNLNLRVSFRMNPRKSRRFKVWEFRDRGLRLGLKRGSLPATRLDQDCPVLPNLTKFCYQLPTIPNSAFHCASLPLCTRRRSLGALEPLSLQCPGHCRTSP